MRLWTTGIAQAAQLLLLCLALVQLVSASALTTKVKPHSKSCFYAWADQRFEKIGFYFAVQDGGNFDIEYIVTSPHDRIIVEGAKSSQEDLIFTANEYGEYSFCFENFVSSYGEKLVRYIANRSTLTSLLSLSRVTSCPSLQLLCFPTNRRLWKSRWVTSSRISWQSSERFDTSVCVRIRVSLWSTLQGALFL